MGVSGEGWWRLRRPRNSAIIVTERTLSSTSGARTIAVNGIQSDEGNEQIVSGASAAITDGVAVPIGVRPSSYD